jgi:hypothetical protein
MSYLNQRSKPALDHERSEVLQQLEDWLETPMLVLGFAWLGLFIVELVWGLNPLLEAIAAIIWIAFIVDFGIKFLLAPRRISYLRHNCLFTIYSSAANLSDFASHAVFAISSCGSRVTVVASDDTNQQRNASPGS